MIFLNIREIQITSFFVAPVKSSFVISEGNETIVQENSFQNETGVLGKYSMHLI